MKPKVFATLVVSTVAFVAAFLLLGLPAREAMAAEITVYKDPQCGCCGKWVEHLEKNGFKVKVYNNPRLDQIKAANGVPYELGACHTALVDGYVVEGHVPADAIKRLLRERPPIKGIAVAGMPAGSPGMESARPQPYDVMSFDGAGKMSVYERH